MGAKIKVEGSVATVDGVDKLVGTVVVASDLRAGAATSYSRTYSRRYNGNFRNRTY